MPAGAQDSAILSPSRSRFHPLRGLPNQGQIWSWISYDVANQSFTLIINTLLFSIFFTKIVVPDPARNDFLWNLTFAGSMLLVVIASPIAGAMTDERPWKKAALLLTGFLCAAFTCALAFIQPGQLWLAVLLYVPANFMYSIGENFLAAFLPSLTTRENIGRVSAFSWGCAYAAALLLLIATAGSMLAFDLESTDKWRPLFVFAGLWFFAFAIPTLLFLKERPVAAAEPRAGGLLLSGFRRLAATVRAAGQFRDLRMLLAASLFYGAAMTVIVVFASIMAQDDFGFSEVNMVMLVAVITISGVAGTLVPMYWQDRIGHRRMTLVLLGLWLVTVAGFVVFSWLRLHSPDPASYPSWPVWLLGNLVGLGLGSLGSANRAFVGYLTPASRSGEFFGLWGLVFKLAAVITIPFGFARDRWGPTEALVVLLVFVVIGMVLTLLVDEKRGAAAARAADERGP